MSVRLFIAIMPIDIMSKYPKFLIECNTLECLLHSLHSTYRCSASHDVESNYTFHFNLIEQQKTEDVFDMQLEAE